MKFGGFSHVWGRPEVTVAERYQELFRGPVQPGQDLAPGTPQLPLSPVAGYCSCHGTWTEDLVDGAWCRPWLTAFYDRPAPLPGHARERSP
jgi:hypothetical protein